MSTVRSWALVALWAGTAACAAPRHAELDAVLPELQAESPAPSDATLAEQSTLRAVLRVALDNNPGLLASRARAEAAFARVPGASRLPDPELKAELWGAPLARPWALDDADTIMVGLRQALPTPGVRDLEGQAFAEEAQAAAQAWRAEALDVARDVQRAWAAYVLAERALSIHRAHIDVAHRLVEVASSLIATGRASQDDVLRLDLEAARLHRDVLGFERDRRQARVRLNALMGREPDAPLGPPPADAALPSSLPPAEGLTRLAIERRPELAAADHRVRAAKASADVRRQESRWPSFMVGADYWLMPDREVTHGYGLMFSMTLPWLSGGRQDALSVATSEAKASERESTALRTQVLAEVGDAYAALESARASLVIVETELLPRAERSFESAQLGFANGRSSATAVLEAMRAVLDLRMERVEARVDVELAWVDLERAVGGPLDDSEALP